MDCVFGEKLVLISASRECREVATRWTIAPLGLPNTTGCCGSPFLFLQRKMHVLDVSRRVGFTGRPEHTILRTGRRLSLRAPNPLAEQALDAIAEPFEQRAGTYLELHASPMYTGKDGWGQFPAAERAQASADVVRVLTDTRPRLNVFAAVVEQSQMLRTADILPYCYEMLSSKFDDYLALKFQRENDPQRGLFVLDQKRATEEKDMQALHRTFKQVGHARGRLRNFAEVADVC